MRHMSISLPTLLLLLATLSACGTFNERIVSKSPTPTISSTEPLTPGQPTVTSPDRPALVKQQLQPMLAENDQQAVLKLIRREVNTGLAEPAIADEYLRALNAIIDRSRTLMNEGKYSLAGQLLQTAQETYPESTELTTLARLPLEELSAWRSRCADELMEQGLVAYRREDLDGALDIWQQILVFDPEHTAASKAVRTTEMQLANLRRLEQQ